MLSLIWVLEAIVVGCLLVCRFTNLPAIRPIWARLLLILGAGAAGGMGLTSCLFFIFGVLLGIPLAAMVLELLVLVWTGYEAFRRRVPISESPGGARFPLLAPITVGCVFIALAIVTGAMWSAWEANPHGNWDAWAIWNLRAKFLTSDTELAQRAWSPVLGATSHSEYPLLVSSFVARCWAFGHSLAAPVPAVISCVFFLALVALAAGGVAVLRGPTLGVLMALVLVTSPPILREVPAQYADVPLACYFAGALVFALLDRPILAGVSAGLAGWTKDEGLLFLVLFLTAVVVFRRRATLAVIAGALPAGAIIAFFKIWLSKGNASVLPASLTAAANRVADLGRYGAVIAAFGRELHGMAAGWYHPILPLIVLAVALRFDRERSRDVAFCAAISATLLVGYLGVYILTPNDLEWQLQTSLGRLLAQLWPALLLIGFVGLRAPEADAVVKPMPPPKGRRKTRR